MTDRTTVDVVVRDRFVASPETEAGRESRFGECVAARVVAPLEEISKSSVSLMAVRGAEFQIGGERFEVPRYVYLGPQAGEEPIRLGLFAGIHGDEPEGVEALVSFVRLLEQEPELARGYCLFIYPICNPSGFEDGTRENRRGRDLNREFWVGSAEPEARLLEAELADRSLHGIISLHTDDTSGGFYGYVSGALFSEHLIRPALEAAARFLPLNSQGTIDGFPARDAIIREGYAGVLRAPPGAAPHPFEIILESPKAPAMRLKLAALVQALKAVLVEYRKFMAYANHL